MAKIDESREPPLGQVISPGVTAVESIDLQALVRTAVSEALAAKRPSKTTPAVQFTAMTDQHIAGLQADKARLHEEIARIRYTEIAHLREDVRWLEVHHLALNNAYGQLKTSYGWVITFNWFSFALIALGGVLVSYASFIPDPPPTVPATIVVTPWYGTQKNIATMSLIGLIIGVFMQAIISFRGSRALMSLADPSTMSDRPTANPPTLSGEDREKSLPNSQATSG